MKILEKGGTKLIVILSAMLIICIATGTTLALTLMNTESRFNAFTFGNLTIELSEPSWDALTAEQKITYPGREFAKDPTVKNTGGTEAYLYVQVRIPRASVRTVDSADKTKILPEAVTDLFMFTLNSGWTQVTTATETTNEYSTYVFAYTKAAVQPGASTETPVFNSVRFINTLEGEPSMGTVLDIPLTAVGIQTGYLNEAGSTIVEKALNAYTIAMTQMNEEA